MDFSDLPHTQTHFCPYFALILPHRTRCKSKKLSYGWENCACISKQDRMSLYFYIHTQCIGTRCVSLMAEVMLYLNNSILFMQLLCDLLAKKKVTDDCFLLHS